MAKYDGDAAHQLESRLDRAVQFNFRLKIYWTAFCSKTSFYDYRDRHQLQCSWLQYPGGHVDGLLQEEHEVCNSAAARC